LHTSRCVDGAHGCQKGAAAVKEAHDEEAAFGQGLHGRGDAIGAVHARVEQQATVNHIEDIDTRRDEECAFGPVGFVHDFVGQGVAGADCQDHDEGEGEDAGRVDGRSSVCGGGGCGGGRGREGAVLFLKKRKREGERVVRRWRRILRLLLLASANGREDGGE